MAQGNSFAKALEYMTKILHFIDTIIAYQKSEQMKKVES
ncbi:MAG: hypothetical protein RL113_1289 [Pseudomonadota bacterium]